ncbi:hypothetical protein AB0N89_02525 [Amycolatopsis sp. NPDC089917]|uniref:hypothetical protein n=1 Tax=Amycolatopsis sp. NPDC089917 TaxID=3155187 RepID=UPI00342A5A6D
MKLSTQREITELIGLQSGGSHVAIGGQIHNLNDLRGGVGLIVAENAGGRVLYVGSVYRPRQRDGLRARLRELLRTPARDDRWDTITVFPLTDQTPEQDVRQLKGTLSIWLVPVESQSWPCVRRG